MAIYQAFIYYISFRKREIEDYFVKLNLSKNLPGTFAFSYGKKKRDNIKDNGSSDILMGNRVKV
jgi:hypothetical protein